MIYKNFKNMKLSALGMGAMRLPTIGSGWTAPIDEAATEIMVDYAIEHGINYFDTAWGYHGGKSETVMGKALGKHPREKWFLADKFPGYDLSNMDKVEEIFDEQLKRCGVEYFDFYLFHNVCEMNIDAYMNEKHGIYKFLYEQREKGKIRCLGFSAHGHLDIIKRFLAAYGDKMEFGQIQLNYIDWTFQEAKEKMTLLNEHHIPVWVMEPMRGGQLASLTDENTKQLKKLRPDENIPAWAFRFIQSIPNVIVALTGASDFEQLKANINTYDKERPLLEHETEILSGIAVNMLSKTTLPCTRCGYCIDHCPQNLNIPYLLELYNEHCFTRGGFLAPMALMALPDEKHPKACIACRKCEEVCTQQIKVSEGLADFADKLKGP